MVYERKHLKKYVAAEIAKAVEFSKRGEYVDAFKNLERAHVLGQGLTLEHTRVHWRMLRIGISTKNPREIFGQLLRIVGAFTKTPFGIYPKGNTGGSNVYFFKPMPIADDLKAILNEAKSR